MQWMQCHRATELLHARKQVMLQKAWVAGLKSVSQSNVTIPANEDLEVPFTITPPNNAEPGEQNGCIVLQEVKDSTFQGGIGLSFRTAIRVAVLVPGPINKELTPVGITVKQDSDNVIVSPEVKNTGNVSLDTTVDTQIRNFLGIKIANSQNTFPVLRDQPTKWSFEFGKPFWGGLYRASYSLTYNASNNGVVGAQASDTDNKTVQGPSTWYFVVPSLSAILIELGILAIITIAIMRMLKSKQHKKDIALNWEPYKVKKGEQVQEIAKAHHISWKKLAAANKLKAPYTLHADQEIKVPPKRKSNKPKRFKKSKK